MYCIVLYWIRWLKFARPPGPRRGRCGAGHRRWFTFDVGAGRWSSAVAALRIQS